MKSFGKWILGIVLLALVVILYPIYKSSNRPRFETFKITQLSTQTNKPSDFYKLTEQSVVVEGPCEEGCQGGVMKDLAIYETKIPNDQKTRNIWLYQVEPTLLKRWNDILGDDELTIYGKQKHDKKIYSAAVPASIVQPHLLWIYIDLEHH